MKISPLGAASFCLIENERNKLSVGLPMKIADFFEAPTSYNELLGRKVTYVGK